MIHGLVLLTLAIGLVFGATQRSSCRSTAPRPSIRGPGEDLGPAVALRVLCVLPFIAVPILISVVSRSTGLALLMTVLVLVVDVALTETPFWQDSPVPWLPGTLIQARSRGSSAATNPSWPPPPRPGWRWPP